MRTRIAVIVLVVLTIASAVLFMMLKSEEMKVAEKFDELAGWCSKKKTAHGLIDIIRLSQNADYIFFNPTLLRLRYSEIKSRKSPAEISRMAMRVRKLFDSIEVSFNDLKIEIYSTENARVVVTADLKAVKGGKAIVSDFTELDCELVKKDGKWLFSEIKTVEVLKR